MAGGGPRPARAPRTSHPRCRRGPVRGDAPRKGTLMGTPTLGGQGATRRDVLRYSLAAAGAAVAFPAVVSATALGRDGATAPSERINLGVIGVGPRCTYDL